MYWLNYSHTIYQTHPLVLIFKLFTIHTDIKYIFAPMSLFTIINISVQQTLINGSVQWKVIHMWNLILLPVALWVKVIVGCLNLFVFIMSEFTNLIICFPENHWFMTLTLLYLYLTFMFKEVKVTLWNWSTVSKNSIQDKNCEEKYFN